MFSSDPLRVHLSLVSHTNIGKTTLARTLLSRDVGEVADRPHVTETTDDYVLARDPAGCELVLWDTPGFGNSVRLAERLRGRSNPIGWFLSEIWDRFTDKAFFLDQSVVRHIRDTSSVVLYLVNVTERPDRAGYIPAEMEILSWIGKPVIVLLNQMGDPSRAKEKEEIEAWQKALAPYPFVHKILPMDAFARCWVQEVALFDAIGEALPEPLSAAYASLREVWVRGRRAVYASSVEAIAHHLTHLLTMTELVPTPSLKDQAISMAQRFGFLKDKTDVVKDAQASLSADAADSFCALTTRLLSVNGLHGTGVNREIIRRMKSDWHLAVYTVDKSQAAVIGAASGAASGAIADTAAAGLTLGFGLLVGAVVGALSGLGAATVYNARHRKEGMELTWSDKALEGFALEALLLYLAIAHFGRGRARPNGRISSRSFCRKTTSDLSIFATIRPRPSRRSCITSTGSFGRSSSRFTDAAPDGRPTPLFSRDEASGPVPSDSFACLRKPFSSREAPASSAPTSSTTSRKRTPNTVSSISTFSPMRPAGRFLNVKGRWRTSRPCTATSATQHCFTRS